MNAVATNNRNLAELKEMIHAALKAVAGLDGDRARERNNVGFSKYDADFGHKLATQHFPLTDKQAPAAFRLIYKYRRQVELAGLTLPTYEELTRALVAHAQGAAKAAHTRVDAEAARRAAGMQIKTGDPTKGTIRLIKEGKTESIEVAFPYDPDMVVKCRAIKNKYGGSYNAPSRTWCFTKAALDEVLTTFDGYAIDWTLDRIKQERDKRKAEAEKANAAKRSLALALLAAAQEDLGPDLDRPLPGGRVMFNHQRTGVKQVFDWNGFTIIADEMGLGKAQPLDAKVLTPTGWKLMGDVGVGDSVIGKNGKATHVTGVYPQGELDIYRVEFTDGSTTECCGDHLWTVSTALRKWRGSAPQVLRLRDMIGKLKTNSGNTRFFVPMMEPAAFTEKALPLDPYLMGAILGDGGISGRGIRFTTADDEMVKRIEWALPEGVRLRRITGSKYDYRISSTDGRAGTNPVTTALRRYHLMGTTSHTKTIPGDYLLASTADRIALLQGLLDTDGHISPRDRNIEYCTVSQFLADDVQFIVQSLGGVARIRRKRLATGGTAYRMSVILPPGVFPFRLTRKSHLYLGRTKYQPVRGIAKITPIGKKAAQCIKVEAQDSLYVTDDFIVTHNTTTALIVAKYFRKVTGARIIVIAPVSVHDTAWRNEARMLEVEIEIYSNHAKKIPAVEVFDGLKQPFMVIADEAQAFQTLTAARTKKWLALTESEHCVASIPLTGTPIKNGRPANLYPLLKAVRHELAENRKEYERVFCAAGATRFSRWDASGASHLDLLHERTKNVILRRKKKDCLDLPKKTRVMRKAELSEVAAARYEAKLDELIASYEERLRKGEIQSGGEVLVEMGQLRHAGSIGKAESAIEIAQEIIEEDRKVVIFTEFEASVSMISDQLTAFGAGVVRLTGETPRKDGHGANGMTVDGCLCRGCIIWRFQNDPKTNVFVGTVKAGGVGVTLTAADTVILVDRPWTPGDAEQAEDRCHRIGQGENVTAIWLQHGDIDERVDDILIQKQERINLVLDGKRKTMRGIETAGDVARAIMDGLLGRTR